MKIGWIQVTHELLGQQPVKAAWLMGKRSWSVIILAVVSILLSKLFFMQVITGGQIWVWSEGNRLEVRKLPAARGVIEDRGGVVLARNSVTAREYPERELFVHAIGVMGQCGPTDGGDVCYPGQIVGKSGLEKYYQQTLAGEDGEEIVEVDAKGTAQRVVARRESVSGKTIRTNLDVGLGRKILEILQEREVKKKDRIKAAIVVSKISSGQVLAMVSWPGYDNNLFVAVGQEDKLKAVLADEKWKPMFNRVSGGVYPPGSVYKLITLLAGLEEKAIDKDTRIEDTGEIKIGEYRYGSWNFDQNGRKEGEMDVIRGLARSNDIFFYKVGEWLGEEKLIAWSKKLGLGVRTGIDISGEVPGLVPNPLERERKNGERWFLGNTYHLAIGQGDLLTTPLQINRMTAEVIVGRKCVPRLVGADQGCEALNTGVENRELILAGMKAVCRTGGTAFEFFDSKMPVACKTGTAQQGGEKDMPHAWVTVVIPKPNEGEGLDAFEEGLAVTVLVEEAGEGSYEAAPMARSILDYVMTERGMSLFTRD